MLKILLWMLALFLSQCREIKTLGQFSVQVKGKPLTDIEVKLDLPIKTNKIFNFSSITAHNMHYLNLIPPALQLIPEKKLRLPTHEQYSILEQLRERQSGHFQQIVLLKNSMLLHLLPNIIISVSEKEHSFEVKEKYGIEGLPQGHSSKMYRISDDQAIMVVQGSDKVYRLGLSHHEQLNLEKELTVAHLHAVNKTHFITAEFEEGVHIYEIDGRDIVQKMKIGQSQLNTSLISIEDLFYHEGSLYILDSRSGIYRFTANNLQIDLSSLKQISSLKGCQSMDYLPSQSLFVLACSLTIPNYLIELQERLDGDSRAYIKQDPIYSQCNMDDLMVTQPYYITFKDAEIDVFWSGMGNDLPHTIQTEEGLEFYSLQCWSLDSHKASHLYVIESGELILYKMVEVGGQLYLNIPEEYNKNIEISVPVRCPLGIDAWCQYKVTLSVHINEENQNKKTITVSIVLVLISVIVLFLLVWICLKKYIGLEKHARQLLQNYQKKQEPAPKFTL